MVFAVAVEFMEEAVEITEFVPSPSTPLLFL